MPFPKGVSGNPGGKRKALGLSDAVRASEGLKTWARLLAIRDGAVLERKTVITPEGPVEVDVTASVKDLRETCKLILAYTWGTPVAIGTDDLEKRLIQLEDRLREQGASLQ